MSPARELALQTLAHAILAKRVGHPLRVAVDGLSAAGKTTLANELDPLIVDRGHPVLRATIDDFHVRGHKLRSKNEEYTAETYYRESYDYGAVRKLLLQPLGPGGNRRVRTGIWDSYNDVPLDSVTVKVDERAIVLVDAAFALHPLLSDQWDVVVWIDVDQDTALRRACERDIAWAGSAEVVESRYLRRTFPAHDLYISETHAPDVADIVIDNRIPERPRIVRVDCE